MQWNVEPGWFEASWFACAALALLDRPDRHWIMSWRPWGAPIVLYGA